MSRPGFYRSNAEEADAFETSMGQTRQTGDLGDRPLIVLSAGQLEEEMAAYAGVDEGAYLSAWEALQQELPELSTNSRRIVAEESGHIIPLYQLELVVDAAREVIALSRAE